MKVKNFFGAGGRLCFCFQCIILYTLIIFICKVLSDTGTLAKVQARLDSFKSLHIPAKARDHNLVNQQFDIIKTETIEANKLPNGTVSCLHGEFCVFENVCVQQPKVGEVTTESSARKT